MELKNADLFFRDNPIPMLIYNSEDYSIRDVNNSMVDLYGYPKDEMLTFTLFDLRPENEVDNLKARLSEIDHDRFSEEGLWKHQKKDGEFIYVKVTRNPVTYRDDDTIYQLVMYIDVTREMNYQQRFEMLFQHSLDGIMLTKPNGEIIQSNKAACEILGMTNKEITKRGRDGIVVQDQKLEEALINRSKTGEFSGELTYIHKSGDKIPVELTSSVFTDFAGEKRTSIIFRDISERKKTEQALRQEKEFTEVVLNSLPGVFYTLSDEGEVIRCNDHSTEVFGMSSDEIIGRSAADFVSEADKNLVPEKIQSVLEKGYEAFEITLNTADGTAVYRFNAERLQQNDQTYIIGTGVDVSKQKELEEQLSSLLKEEHHQRKKAEADRDKLKEMFEEAPSPKCVLEGPELRYVIANKAYREVVGQQNIVGKRVADVIPEVESQGYLDLLNEVYRTGEPYLGTGDRVVIDKEKEKAKEEFIFNLLFAPLSDENGEVYGIFVEAMDFSKQIGYQKKLEESLKEKETLLAEIHHRVKNNLAIITGIMELQVMDTENEVIHHSLRSAQQRIKTIAIIHELLYGSESLSHLNFGENIKQLVTNISDIYGRIKPIEVDLQVDPIAMNINQAIPSALVVNEVVTNAYKHAFKNRKEGKITVKLHEEKGRVYIEISDNGAGIPDELRNDTSSIGMKLVDLLKQQLNAKLEISNNNGTLFRLEFKKTDVKGIGSSLLKD